MTTLADNIEIEVEFSEGDEFECSFEDETFNVEFDDEIVVNEYEGSYQVTPSSSTQTLVTVNKNLSQNIIINPIPNNYGLITYDGSVITVS